MQTKSLVRFQLAPALCLVALVAPADAGEIRGRILIGGAPAPSVTLEALPYEAPIDEARRLACHGAAPRPMAVATTRPDGGFVLTTAAAAIGFRVQAHGGGVVPAWLGGTFDSADTEDLGDETLPRARSLAGRILSANGAPVAGAEVTVTAATSPEDDPDVVPASRTVTTGADGAFRCDEAGSANRLAVEAKGYGATSVANVGSGSMLRPITLGPGMGLAGTVLRADRKSPAGGALVHFEAAGIATRWVEAGADGGFRLADLPPRKGHVVVEAGEAGIGDVSAGATAASAITVVLAPPATLAGNVVDVGTRALVPRARISVDDGARTILVRGGPDGRYEIRGLAPEHPYRLKVDEARYAPFEHAGILVVTGAKKRLDVPLRRAASISGRVVDEAGKPVAGALGRLVSRGDNTFMDRRRLARGGGRVVFRTGPDGAFSATSLTPGDDQRLTVLHPDFEPRLVAGLSLPPGGNKAGLTVVLRRGLAATGIVRDEAGQPVADAEVEMLPLRGFGGRGGAAFAGGGFFGGGGGGDAGGGAQRPRATTRSDGRFEVKGLSEGDYALSVAKDGYAGQSVEPVRIRADTASSVELTLAAGASIRGSVFRPDGSGAEGYAVRAVPSGSRRPGPAVGGNLVTTPADGSFSISGLRPGESYDLVILTRDRPATRREGVGAPADGLEIVLPSPGRISGRVVDAQTQSPVADFQVSFQPDRSSGGGGFGPGGGGRGGGGGRAGFMAALAGRGRQALHSDDGSFVLDDVPAGTWEVVTQAEGYQTARIGGITLEEGGKRDGVDVRLRRGAGIQGQILDANSGQPILDVAITLRRPGGAAAPTLAGDADARTDSDGRYTVGGLAAGSYTVMARHPDYADGSTLVDVKDAPVSADLRLTPGGSVGGTVLSEANAPLPGATVTLGAGGGGFGRGGAFGGGQTTMSDDAGHFEFTHVTAGRYAVAASIRSRQTTPIELVLQAGETRENLVLSLAAGARIHGLVSGLPSALRGNVSVSANGPDGYFTSARAGADGSYEVGGAPAGPINLRATASDQTGSTRSATSQVSIADGQTDAEANIAFETGFTLSGAVTRAGQAVADATVSAGLQGGGGRMASARTDDAGAYRLEGLLQGTYSVTAAAANGRPQRQTATLSDDTTLDFVLPSARVAGVVIESGSQQPLPDATVQATPQDATGPPGRGAATDSNGRFSIDGLEPQVYVVSARKPGYQVESKSVTPSDTGGDDVVLELVRGDGIGLEMRDAQFGVPVRAAQARAVDARGGVGFAGGVMLDSDGRGEIPSLRSGSYVLTLYAAGYAPAIVAATSPSPHVLVAVSPGGTLEIHAGPQTLAAGTARGQILTTDGQPYPFSPFASDGRFTLSAPIRRLENLGAGSYLIVMDGGSPKAFELAAGALAVVTLP